jgi:hypothetical protein
MTVKAMPAVINLSIKKGDGLFSAKMLEKICGVAGAAASQGLRK